MPLEMISRRLVIRAKPLLQECNRTFASMPQRRQQSATAALADTFENNRRKNQPRASPAPSTTSRIPETPASSPLPQFTEQSPTSTPDFDLARSAVAEATQSRRSIAQRQLALDQERGWSRQDLERQMMYRRFTPGDVYAPHDLTGVEFSKWKKQRRKEKTKYDVLDQLNVNPEHHYKNFSIMSEYMTDLGRIKHSNETNLRPVNQRRMARAIRRAIGVGILMPSTHRHPEIIRKELTNKNLRF